MPLKDRQKRLAYQREWYAQHYAKNPDYYKQRNQRYRERKREWFKNYKSSLSCERCGESHPATLDFHHKDNKDKEYTISNALTEVSMEKLKEEIQKCEVLCSNCHRKHHYNERIRATASHSS